MNRHTNYITKSDFGKDYYVLIVRAVVTGMAGTAMAIPQLPITSSVFYIFNCTYIATSIPHSIYHIHRYCHYNALFCCKLCIGLSSQTIIAKHLKFVQNEFLFHFLSHACNASSVANNGSVNFIFGY